MSRALRKLSRMNDSQLRSFIQLIADDYALFDAMMDSLTSGVIILDSPTGRCGHPFPILNWRILSVW